MKKKRSSRRRKPQIYGDEFKWKVVQEVLSGKIVQRKPKSNITSEAILSFITRF